MGDADMYLYMREYRGKRKQKLQIRAKVEAKRLMTEEAITSDEDVVPDEPPERFAPRPLDNPEDHRVDSSNSSQSDHGELSNADMYLYMREYRAKRKRRSGFVISSR